MDILSTIKHIHYSAIDDPDKYICLHIPDSGIHYQYRWNFSFALESFCILNQLNYLVGNRKKQ